MKLARFLFLGTALLVANAAAAAAEGLPAGWKVEKEIPAIGAGPDQIPAEKLTLWVEQGWLVAKLETKAGDLEWQVVLARAKGAQPPKVHVDPEFDFLSVAYGAYFIREISGHLRILRERKNGQSPAWLIPAADPIQALRGSALSKLFLYEAGDWFWLTSGPAQNKPDVRIRFQHKELTSPGWGATGFRGDLGQIFCGDSTCQDEGDLLIAKRMLRYVAAATLKTRKVKKEFVGKAAPALVAKLWLNTPGELGLDQFKGKVVLLDFWGQWCGPCVKKLPRAEEMHVKYKDKGLVVIGVHSANQSEKVADFLKEEKISFPVMIDQGATAERYVIEAWPTYFLIDKAGKVSWGFANDFPSNARIEELLTK